MADIYTTPNWVTATTYEKDTVVINNSFYYYAKNRHVSAAAFLTDFNNGLWLGTTTINGQTKPFFPWTPSFGYSLDIEPKVKTISFGDQYAQILADGINNILLPFNLDFNDRDLAEYSAILHFLHTRAGYGEFYFIPPSPYNILKKFTCPQWTPTQNSYDKYSIRVLFKEKV